MNSRRQITPTENPTLGPIKLGLIGLATTVIVGFVVQSRVPAQGYFDRYLVEMLPAGCVYGLAAAGCWIATVIENRYLRFAVRAWVVIATASLFSILRDQRQWLAIATDFAGLSMTQCAIFFLGSVPDWRYSRTQTTEPVSNSKNQFGISDLAIATTVFALLLSFVIRYAPPIQSPAYWMVAVAVWMGGGVITLLIAKAMTATHSLATLLLLVFSLLLSVAGTYTIGYIDAVVDSIKAAGIDDFRGRFGWTDVEAFVSFYGRIVVGYWMTFALIACFARIRSSAGQPS